VLAPTLCSACWWSVAEGYSRYLIVLLLLSTCCSLLTSDYYLIFIVPFPPTDVVLSLAVGEGYFRFSPEHEQWVELVDGTSNETNVISFNHELSGVQSVSVYINGSDTAASWSPEPVDARPYNLTYRPPLSATNIASVFSLTTEGTVKSVSDIDMEGPVLRSLLNRSTCYFDADLEVPEWVCPLRLNITLTSTLAEQHANYSILVLLHDVDEFPPVLSPSSSTQFTVSEGIPVNTVLVSFDSQQPAINHSGNVNVTDEDFFSRNRFSFLQDSSTLFLFDSTRGILRTHSPLSTLQPEYPVTCQHDVCFMVLQFTVFGEVMQSTFTANISLRPTPRYISLTPNTGSVEVSEAFTVGAVLVSFSPHSVQGLVDVAVNSSHDQLKLAFTDPAIAASGYFLLSDTNKTLSLQRTLDLDGPLPPFLAACSASPCVAMIGVQVGVFGGGVSAEFRLSLSVTALNEFEPTFSSAPYSATVPEHAPLGSKVLEVECEDADRFEEVVVSIVSWTPSTEPLPFTLNGSTLLVTGRVNYEEVAIYWMNMSCSDGERENVTEVEVDVRNISNHPPIPQSMWLHVCLSCACSVHSPLARVHACSCSQQMAQVTLALLLYSCQQVYLPQVALPLLRYVKVKVTLVSLSS